MPNKIITIVNKKNYLLILFFIFIFILPPRSLISTEKIHSEKTTHKNSSPLNNLQANVPSTVPEKISSLVNPRTGEVVYNLCQFCPATEKINIIKFSPDQKKVAGGTDNGIIYIWDLSQGETPIIKIITTDISIKDLEWFPDSVMIITDNQRSNIDLWNSTNGKLIKTFDTSSSINEISHISLSSNGKYLAIASLDSQISLWAINGLQLLFLKSFDYIPTFSIY